MKLSAFKEGINILSAYLDEDSHLAIRAQHEQIWVGDSGLTDVEDGWISEEDFTRLEALGWFVDGDEDNGTSWSCFV